MYTCGPDALADVPGGEEGQSFAVVGMYLYIHIDIYIYIYIYIYVDLSV